MFDDRSVFTLIHIQILKRIKKYWFSWTQICYIARLHTKKTWHNSYKQTIKYIISVLHFHLVYISETCKFFSKNCNLTQHDIIIMYLYRQSMFFIILFSGNVYVQMWTERMRIILQIYTIIWLSISKYTHYT